LDRPRLKNEVSDQYFLKCQGHGRQGKNKELLQMEENKEKYLKEQWDYGFDPGK
jgi:hypothetical protein